jgi:hypothetical protein
MLRLAETIAQNDKEYELTYGALHIVIDDWNLDSHHIEWCLSQTDAPRPPSNLERSIGEEFLAMSMAERVRTMEVAEARSQELHRRLG